MGGIADIKVPMFEPFRQGKHAPRDIGYGGPSTERTITNDAPDGGYWNIPTIWWTQSGEPVELDMYQAQQMAMDYEQKTGHRFPRFENPGAGAFMSMNKSAMGGADR